MITVPANQNAPQGQPAPQQPKVDPTYLLMAAAAMHQDGRLFAQNDEKPPVIEHEAPLEKEKGQNFETLYNQLESLKDKVKPGNILRLYNEKGNNFHYERDDDYEHGFKLKILPREVS